MTERDDLLIHLEPVQGDLRRVERLAHFAHALFDGHQRQRQAIADVAFRRELLEVARLGDVALADGDRVELAQQRDLGFEAGAVLLEQEDGVAVGHGRDPDPAAAGVAMVLHASRRIPNTLWISSTGATSFVAAASSRRRFA